MGNEKLYQDKFPPVDKYSQPMLVAYTVFSGIPGISEEIKRVKKWIEDNGYTITYPPITVYYDDPSEVGYDKCKCEVQWPIGEKIAAFEDNIGIKEVPVMRVLSVIHKGPYNKIYEAYNFLFEIIRKEELTVIEAPREIYIGDCYNTPEEKIVTEVQWPIQ